MCRYAKNDGCPLEKALYSLKKEQGGTNGLMRHTASNKAGQGRIRFQRQLPLAARKTVANAAALAVCLDIRPLCFCSSQASLNHFARTLFEMGQTVPANERIDPWSYLPGRTAITNAVKDISS